MIIYSIKITKKLKVSIGDIMIVKTHNSTISHILKLKSLLKIIEDMIKST